MNADVNFRPRNVTIAGAVFCLALIYNFASTLMSVRSSAMIGGVSKNGESVFLIVFACITAFFIYKILKRRNWARIVYLVFFLLGLGLSLVLGILFSAPGATFHPTMWEVLSLIVSVAQAVAIVLLFTGAGSAWFKFQSV